VCQQGRKREREKKKEKGKKERTENVALWLLNHNARLRAVGTAYSCATGAANGAEVIFAGCVAVAVVVSVLERRTGCGLLENSTGKVVV